MAEKLPVAQFGAPDKPLIIGGIELQCYVLEDEKRVVTQRSLYKFLGITQGSGRGKYGELGGAARLVRFLDNLSSKSREINRLRVMLTSPIQFEFKRTIYYGYEGVSLQELVRAISKEYLRGKLSVANRSIGQRAEMLDDAFAKVGIIALIDEVTGYQYVRDREALNKILEKYISGALGKWAQRFPDEFYEQIFRLNGWNYDPESVKRPGVIGTWTNDIIYDRLAPGVLKELKRKSPPNENGRKAHYHRWLTNDIGHPALSQQIHTAMGFMRANTSWRKFVSMYNRAFPRMGDTIEINFPDQEE